jgi:hypothetical protein
MKKIVWTAVMTVSTLAAPGFARAETIACRSAVSTVKAVTIAEDYFAVTTRFQMDTPNLQPLLQTSIVVTSLVTRRVGVHRQL